MARVDARSLALPALLAGLLAFALLSAGAHRGPADPRFGVAVAYLDGAKSLSTQLGRVGAGSWYTYGLAPGERWVRGRVVLLRTGRGMPRYADAEIAAAARANPGAAWLIGNEPNVPGQDEIDGAGYDREFRHYRQVIRAADPRAVIVAPNLQNITAPCIGCEGAVVGATFLDEWRAAHRVAGDGEPELDVFGLHLYNIDWDRLPMTDAGASLAQLRAAREYLDRVPEWRGRPIWVTELGVIWGYPGYELEQSAGRTRVRPVGSLDRAAMLIYLRTMLVSMLDQSDRLGVKRWFVFSNAQVTEPFATAPGGIGLFTGPEGDAAMTELGAAYAALARRGR